MSANPRVIAGGDITGASTTLQMPLGTRVRHYDSNRLPCEYMYVKAGDEGLTVGQVCIISGLYVTTLLDQNGTATDLGPVGVALGTVAAASYCFVQIAGPATVACLADITSGTAAWNSTTAGSVDDTASDGDEIVGMRFTAAEAATGGDGFVTVEMTYPWAGKVDTHS